MTPEQAVWADPGSMSRTPCLRGSRLPAQQQGWEVLDDGS